MHRVLIVPGLAVHGYAQEAAEALAAAGFDAALLPAPGEPGSSADLTEYGHELAGRIKRDGAPVHALVGLSVGSQSVAVAAARTSLVRHLVLVSPTVDPAVRTLPQLLVAWAASGRKEKPQLMLEQAPEWWRAGPRRLNAGLRSALEVQLEKVLPSVEAELTVVHTEHDGLTSHSYAARLAADHSGRLVVIPDASHSWPYRDADRFVRVMKMVLGG
jgi:hypothetical protein